MVEKTSFCFIFIQHDKRGKLHTKNKKLVLYYLKMSSFVLLTTDIKDKYEDSNLI